MNPKFKELERKQEIIKLLKSGKSPKEIIGNTESNFPYQ